MYDVLQTYQSWVKWWSWVSSVSGKRSMPPADQTRWS